MKKSGVCGRAISRAPTSISRPRERSLIEIAIATCLLAARAASADQATDTTMASSNELAEVTVTAQRRTENLQDVPIAIQAMTGETLAQLSVENFDDVVKYLPNVTLAGAGPGQSGALLASVAVI